MLADPRPALAEQSNFIGYLVGLASVARVVHALAADGNGQADPPREADDFVYLLMGFAGLGRKIERLAESARAQPSATARAATRPPSDIRWLR
jgi:hypothetical protein